MFLSSMEPKVDEENNFLETQWIAFFEVLSSLCGNKKGLVAELSLDTLFENLSQFGK